MALKDNKMQKTLVCFIILQQMITKYILRAIYPLPLILITLWSCKPDTNSAKWDVDLIAPIINSRIDINDLVEDSLIAVDSENQISLYNRSRLANFNFDRISEGFSKFFENTVKLQNINLGTRIVENRISLGELAASAGITGTLIILNNGNTTAIPAFTGIGPSIFPLDAADLFQTMTLDDGWLVVEIHNGLPIDITNVQYSMQNQSGGSPIISKTVPLISAGADYSDSIQLNNGVVVEGKLEALLQNMDTPGSNGNAVLIDTSDALDIKVTIRDLKPFSATAIFPDQILLQDTSDTEIEDFSGELTSMHVGEGKMVLNATSTIEDEIVFSYSIPSAVKNSVGLEFTENVPPAPIGGFSSHYAEKDIVGYDVDLTGQPGAMNVYNTFFTITDGQIDSSGNLINLSLTDSVFLKTGITGLIASRGYGYLGLDILQSTEETKVDLFDDLQGGIIDFEEIIISVEIDNYIGAPIDARINSLSSSKGSQTKNLLWTNLNQDLVIPAATENNPGDKPSPGKLVLNLNKVNSNIDELLEIQPNLMVTNLSGYLNQSLTVPDYNQFIYLDYGMEIFISTEVPLHMSAENVLFKDTSDFNYTNLDPSNRLQSGDLIVIADNYFPFQVNMDLILLNSDSVAIDTLVSSEFIKPGTVNTDGTVTEKIKSMVRYELTPEIIAHLKESEFILFEATFNTASLPNKVRFYTDSHMDITLSGDVTLRTGK